MAADLLRLLLLSHRIFPPPASKAARPDNLDKNRNPIRLRGFKSCPTIKIQAAKLDTRAFEAT